MNSLRLERTKDKAVFYWDNEILYIKEALKNKLYKRNKGYKIIKNLDIPIIYISGIFKNDENKSENRLYYSLIKTQTTYSILSIYNSNQIESDFIADISDLMNSIGLVVNIQDWNKLSGYKVDKIEVPLKKYTNKIAKTYI